LNTPVALSVVIVNWNAGSELRACLESIVANPPQCSWEVVVVDNGSTDESVAGAREVLAQAQWVLNSENRGLAAANNQGLIAAQGAIVVLSNPDVRFLPGALDAFSATLDRYRDSAFVVPHVVFPDGELQTTAGDLPTLSEAVLGRQFQRRKPSVGQARGFCWDGWGHDEERDVGRAGDVCYAARRDAIVDLGLQDERFPLDWEAIDWSARAREAGWRIVFCPRARVVHQAGISTEKAPRTRWVVDTHRGMYRYFANRGPAWRRPGLAALFGTRALVKIAAIEAGIPMYERARRSSGFRREQRRPRRTDRARETPG
jgi:N-acetylglucosaminyl-diphospho-decaprenol L-rhamnosyltransferase